MKRFRWVIIPNAVSIGDEIPGMVRLAGVEAPAYVGAVLYPSVDKEGFVNIDVVFYSVEGDHVRPLPPTVAELHLRSIESIRVIYAPEIFFSPEKVFMAWRRFMRSAEKSTDRNVSMTEMDYARSVLVPYLMRDDLNKDIVFISDHFPHPKHLRVFDVKPYVKLPRDIVLASEIVSGFDGDVLAGIRQWIKRSVGLFEQSGYIVKTQVEEMLNVIFKRFLISPDVSPSLGNFLIVGPPGVGKTTFAKQLAKVLFGTDEVFARIDLNTFSHRYALQQYLFDEFRSPFIRLFGYRRGVVLWDEADKIDSDAYDLLMQILEEGEIRLNNGERIYTANLVHIFTANRFIEKKELGLVKKKKTEAEQYLEGVKEWFRNEAFLDRLDKVLYMGPLTLEEAKEVATQMLEQMLCDCVKNKKTLTGIKRWIGAELKRRVEQGAYLTPRLVRKLITEYIVSHF